MGPKVLTITIDVDWLRQPRSLEICLKALRGIIKGNYYGFTQDMARGETVMRYRVETTTQHEETTTL